MQRRQIFFLVLWIAAFEAVSAAIGYATRPEVDVWYKALERPWFTPPNILFPVVWTMLYALIASAGFFIWQARRSDKNGMKRLSLFTLYMALNWSWSFVFFTAGQLFAGLMWIIALNIASIALIGYCWRDLRVAAVLLLPPLAWTSFAALLNGAFWWLNRGV